MCAENEYISLLRVCGKMRKRNPLAYENDEEKKRRRECDEKRVTRNNDAKKIKSSLSSVAASPGAPLPASSPAEGIQERFTARKGRE